MQPKLLIDSKIEKCDAANNKFSLIVEEYNTALKNLDKWDAFSRADSQLAIVQKAVDRCD